MYGVKLLLGALVLTLMPQWSVVAQAPDGEPHSVVRAEVLEVRSSELRTIPGTETSHTVQTLVARMLEGPSAGEEVSVENDFLELRPGDAFFATRFVDESGAALYHVQDADRRGSLIGLVALFVIMILVFGGWYGLRALAALGASLYAIGYILVPGLLAGWNPLWACFLIASAIITGALLLTHGPNRESLIACTGTLLAIGATVLFTAWSVSWTHLSGFGADASVYLNFSTRGSLDLVGLLIGAMVIGALGVLDDVAITQVAVVRELLRAGGMRRRQVFLRALRVGREHVGAVVNTLALAYTGAALPLVLLMHLTPTSTGALFNMEIFATELVRVVVGTFGIVLAVPFTTALAAWKLSAPVPGDMPLKEPQGHSGPCGHCGMH